MEFATINGKLSCKWIADAQGFNMPVKVRIKGGEYKYITPTRVFTPINIDGITKDNLEVDTYNYYIGVLID